MPESPVVQPLSQRHRSLFFYLLLTTFAVLLPLFFLYATGYRFLGEEGTFVRTGGIYVAAERTGASIFVDGELVRETRVFRRAFYAQSLDPGTHRVHVQKEDHHTWVKELPVYPHLVTEAQAFNLPLVPQVRIISPLQTLTGAMVLSATSTLYASTTNDWKVVKVPTLKNSNPNPEFDTVMSLFSTTTASSSLSLLERVSTVLVPEDTSATSTAAEVEIATTTKNNRNVRLYESTGDVWVEYAGPREEMPYYFCAEPFERYSTSTLPLVVEPVKNKQTALALEAEEALMHPIQSVTEESECDPVIRIDRQGEALTSFDFFPGSTDFVVVALESGIYMVEVDDRAWQNSQPLLLGENLDMRVENGNIYVYDGELIYQIQLED